jgi:hypothetical protein
MSGEAYKCWKNMKIDLPVEFVNSGTHELLRFLGM